MRHAVLGIGGVGGLVAGMLAKSGQQVDAIVRPQVLAAQPDHILIDQPRGQILANVRITSVLDRSVGIIYRQMPEILDALVAGKFAPESILRFDWRKAEAQYQLGRKETFRSKFWTGRSSRRSKGDHPSV